MAKHEFGGGWTTDKLDRVRKYLCAYVTIFTRNPKAQYFTTVYVDAFAGTGHRVDSDRTETATGLFEVEPDPETEAYKKGSARIALEVQPPFDRFIFIERAAERVKELEALRDQFPTKAQGVVVE